MGWWRWDKQALRCQFQHIAKQLVTGNLAKRKTSRDLESCQRFPDPQQWQLEKSSGSFDAHSIALAPSRLLRMTSGRKCRSMSISLPMRVVGRGA